MLWNRIGKSPFLNPPSLRTRRRDLIELTGIYALILVVIWTPRPWQWAMWGVAVITVSAVFAFSFDGFEVMGLGRVNLIQSMWGVAVAGTVATAAVVVAVRLHTLHLPSTPILLVRHYGAYAIFAMLQQLILQCFFLSRSMRLFSNATAAAGVSAGLFAIAHLPNPVLTVITLFCGLASCFFFLRYRNLWPLAVAHAILGICIGITIPGQVDHNMRVGISYLTYLDRSMLSRAAHSAKP